MVGKRMLLLGLGLLALTVGVTALAWACSPRADVYVTGAGGSGFAYPGTAATVEVSRYAEGTPVTVTASWNEGQPVATGTGPSFTATIQVPNLPDGVYYITADGIEVSGTHSGNHRAGSAALRVGEPGTASRGANRGEGPSSQPTAGSGPPRPAAGSTSGSASGGESAVSGIESRSATGGDRAVARIRAGDGNTAGTAGGTAGKRGAATTAVRSVRTLASGQAVFADSVGANTPKGAPAAKRAGGVHSAKATAPRSSASADLWSGFASGGAPAALAGSSVGPQSGPGPALTLSLVLGAMGVLALLGGVAVAEVRRRRRPTRSGAAPRD